MTRTEKKTSKSKAKEDIEQYTVYLIYGSYGWPYICYSSIKVYRKSMLLGLDYNIVDSGEYEPHHQG